jgi:pimeloyl-ACP methyl ester carboxylesterase
MDVVEVRGVGHAPMLDEPEAKAAIFPFLSEVP